jgi:hypothetical protein
MKISGIAGAGVPALTFALVCGIPFANVRSKGTPEEILILVQFRI